MPQVLHSNNSPSEEANASCVGEVWNLITELANHCFKGIKFVTNESWLVITKGVRFSWQVACWLGNHILSPIANTGINVAGYFCDKLFFGAPFLRSYLHHGLFPNEVSPEWRDWVRNNTGWDIYETMGKLPSDALGILGLGIGYGNILNHFVTSIYFNIRNYFNLLGSVGVYGDRKNDKDERHLAVKGIFGILSAPIVFPVVTLTNVSDAFFLFLKQLGLSFWHNVRVSANLLGENGVLGSRNHYEDKRGLAVKIFFGILSAPFVGAVSLISNLSDVIFSFINQTGLSFWRNLAPNYNLLGKDGIFGVRRKYMDPRNLVARIFFGFVSAPLVCATMLFTNTIDVLGTFIKNFLLSCWHNFRVSYHLLGKHGVFGERQPFEDKRGLPAKIIFGLLSAPFVAPAIVISNAVDLLSSVTKNLVKNFTLSFWYNLRVSYNLLGKKGVFGPRLKYDDPRPLFNKILYGILSAPLVGVGIILTNAVDLTLSFVKQLSLSFYNNFRVCFNLLGNWGIFGPRLKFEDDRGLPAKIFFGLISTPAVMIAAIISNTVDTVFTVFAHSMFSLFENLGSTFNILLGDKGLFGPRHGYVDGRSLAAKICYGMLTLPIVSVATVFTNTLDLLGTFTKHLALSCLHNIAATSHLLGKHGVFGERSKFEDRRHLATKIIFGTLTAPFVFSASLITNTLDLVGSYFKHWKHTIKTPALFTTGVTVGITFALPAFMLRKTGKGMFNLFVKPFQDHANKQAFDGWRVLRAGLNVATLGLSSAVVKIFKAASGYSHRFGFVEPSAEPTNAFIQTQTIFRDAIQLAIKGKLPGMFDTQTRIRPFLRTFYGMRNKVEEILKALHNAYRSYARKLEGNHEQKTSIAFNINSFFQSTEFKSAEDKIKTTLRAGEEDMLAQVERYLKPSKV